MAYIFRKKSFALVIILFLVFFSGAKPADAWMAIPAAILEETMRVTREIINGIQMGAAKTAAVQALNQEINFLVTGSAGGPMFVMNWRGYLIEQPTNDTNLQLNAIIDRSLNGQGSLSGYIPKGFEGVGTNFSYQNQLAQNARRLSEKPICKNNYIGEPLKMFDDPSKGMRNLSLFTNGNDPVTSNLCFSAERRRLLDENTLIAQTKVISPGILGKEVDGMTVTPAGVIEAQLNKVKTMGMDVITNARYIPEIMTAVVSQMITQSIQQGIGEIQVQVHQGVSNVKIQAQTQMNQAIQQNGPGALYRR